MFVISIQLSYLKIKNSDIFPCLILFEFIYIENIIRYTIKNDYHAGRRSHDTRDTRVTVLYNKHRHQGQ